MGYWEEIKDAFAKGIDLAKEGIKEGADTVVQKTKEGAGVVVKKTKEGVTYAQLKAKLLFKHSEFRDALADLGDAVHDLYKESKDIYADTHVKQLIEKVNAVEDECKKIESEIQAVGK